MATQNKPTAKGIHSEEVLECGCILKKYMGGVNAVDDPCKKHKKRVSYHCRVCELELPTERQLKKHRWTHAI